MFANPALISPRQIFLSRVYRKSRWECIHQLPFRVERLGVSRTHHNA